MRPRLLVHELPACPCGAHESLRLSVEASPLGLDACVTCRTDKSGCGLSTDRFTVPGRYLRNYAHSNALITSQWISTIEQERERLAVINQLAETTDQLLEQINKSWLEDAEQRPDADGRFLSERQAMDKLVEQVDAEWREAAREQTQTDDRVEYSQDPRFKIRMDLLRDDG